MLKRFLGCLGCLGGLGGLNHFFAPKFEFVCMIYDSSKPADILKETKRIMNIDEGLPEPIRFCRKELHEYREAVISNPNTIEVASNLRAHLKTPQGTFIIPPCNNGKLCPIPHAEELKTFRF
jgi:hypothetical protein